MLCAICRGEFHSTFLLSLNLFCQADPVVYSVHDVKAVIIGADRGRFKAEINFDASVLASRCMQVTAS